MAESAMYLFCFRRVTAEFDLLKAEMPASRRLIGGFGELFSGVRADKNTNREQRFTAGWSADRGTRRASQHNSRRGCFPCRF